MEKAVVLARGLGTRMRQSDADVPLNDEQAAVAETGVKALIPLERPFLDYVLSAMADAGFRRVCLVVAPDHDMIRRYYLEEIRSARVDISFTVQAEPRGTADAVLAAEAFAANEPFLVVNSDNYYPVEAFRALRSSDGCATALFDRDAMLAGSNIDASRLRQFAIGQIDRQGHLRRIVEKPDEATLAQLARPLWLSMNCWRFGPEIFRACREIRPSTRGELEIPDAVQHAIEVLGISFQALTIRASVLDLTGRRDIAAVAARLSDVEVRL